MTEQPSDRLKTAVAAHQEAKRTEERARHGVYAAILEDLARGVRQVDIVRLTGYTREHIRQIVIRSSQNPKEGR